METQRKYKIDFVCTCGNDPILKGSWNWDMNHRMNYDRHSNKWLLTLELVPNTYEYGYQTSYGWRVDTQRPTVTNSNNTNNNVLPVSEFINRIYEDQKKIQIDNRRLADENKKLEETARSSLSPNVERSSDGGNRESATDLLLLSEKNDLEVKLGETKRNGKKLEKIEKDLKELLSKYKSLKTISSNYISSNNTINIADEGPTLSKSANIPSTSVREPRNKQKIRVEIPPQVSAEIGKAFVDEIKKSSKFEINDSGVHVCLIMATTERVKTFSKDIDSTRTVPIVLQRYNPKGDSPNQIDSPWQNMILVRFYEDPKIGYIFTIPESELLQKVKDIK